MNRALRTFTIVCIGIAAGAVNAFADTPTAPPDNGVHLVVPKTITPQLAFPKLITDKAKYAHGQAVHLTFSIANTTKMPLSYSFSTTQQYDVTISNSAGTAVWHWSKGKMFGQIVTKLTLSPGQSKVYEIPWTQVDDSGAAVAPGIYKVVATTTPMPRFILSGGIVVSPDKDPTNMGRPTKTDADSGETLQTNGTPAVTAKTNIEVL